jgi:hypothetical protein
MIKIGLLGEAPHDTLAISALLRKHFGDQVHFFPLVNNVRGDLIQEQWVKHRLRTEYQIQKPHLVIFIRDLDALEDDQEQIRRRKDYFRDFRTVVDGKAILLLNIYAIEALILADIEKYNEYNKCSLEAVPDPMKVPKPEVHLKERSSYREGQLSAIFEVLRLDEIRKNCRYFAEFMEELTQVLG